MEESPPERTKAISINRIDADTRMVNTSNKEKGKFFANKLTFVFDKKKTKKKTKPKHSDIFQIMQKEVSLFFFFFANSIFERQHQGLQCL